MRPPRHLVVFLRAPRLGRVKTRLGAEIGALTALHFYRATVERVLRPLARDPRWRFHLAVTPDHRTRLPRGWPRAPLIGQGRGDLGWRMARVFRSLPPGPALIVGSDVPDLAPHHVAAAFRALGGHDAVFGPAADGGYWLVGFRRGPRLPHGAFAGVRWSSAQALDDTLASLPRGLAVAFLPMLEDVDDAASYCRWLSRRRI
jgi:rSAM/selenodomain-associated transferase 1